MAVARSLSVAPATEPLTTAEAKLHLRVDHDTEDTLIDNLVTAARRYAEAFTRRSFIETTWIEYFDDFPEVIYPERNPVISITTLTYYDAAGVQQTLVSGTDYQSDLKSEPARIAPYQGTTWPSVETDRLTPVELTYKAGFGAAAANVHQEVKQALLLIVGHLYENREQVSDKKLFEMPFAAESLLGPHRMIEM